MMNNLCMPYYEPGSRPTGRATADLIGKRFVAISAKKDPGSRELEPDPGGAGGNIRIAQAAADDLKTIGVAEHDAKTGEVTAILRAGFIVPITAGVALAFGDLVGPGAGGKAVKPGAGIAAKGISLSDAAVDQDAIVALI
jgi:Uncharacterized conserved protein (DUF2190)